MPTAAAIRSRTGPATHADPPLRQGERLLVEVSYVAGAAYSRVRARRGHRRIVSHGICKVLRIQQSRGLATLLFDRPLPGLHDVRLVVPLRDIHILPAG